MCGGPPDFDAYSLKNMHVDRISIVKVTPDESSNTLDKYCAKMQRKSLLERKHCFPLTISVGSLTEFASSREASMSSKIVLCVTVPSLLCHRER